MAWRSPTKAGLRGFRFLGLRHCAISQLAESGTADSTIMAIAGRINGRMMLERYGHVRMEAERAAMESLAKSRKWRVMTQTTTQILCRRTL